MGDRDSSPELTIKRVASVGKEKPKFDSAPRDLLYTFKFKDVEGKSYSLLQYTLEDGKKLPHITLLEGMLDYDFLLAQAACVRHPRWRNNA